MKAQLVFWLVGATDGHAKNFSIFLGPGGSYHLTPLYDVLTAQPSLDSRQIERKQMKLAMSVGKSRHYRIDAILARHFVQTGEQAGLPKSLVPSAIQDIAGNAKKALAQLESALPADFPEFIHTSVSAAVKARLRSLELSEKT